MMRGLLRWLRGRLPGAARAYKHPVIRASQVAVAGAVTITMNAPYAGLALQIGDAAILSIADRYLAGNPQELARNTNERIQAVKDRGRFDPHFVESPEFHGAVVQAVLASAQETEREKIDLYAEILAGATSRDRPAQLDLRALLSALTILSIREMELAKRFYVQTESTHMSFVDGLQKPDWGPDTDFYLRRLQGVGLLDIRNAAAVYGGALPSFHATATFHRLMSLLAEGRRDAGGQGGRDEDAPAEKPAEGE